VTGSVNANDAVHVSLIQPGIDGPTVLQDFHPQFTYPIVGEAEQIFGYKDLDIGIQFAAHDLRPHVVISYDRKFATVGSTSALDVNKKLKEFLPPIAFERSFEAVVQNDVAAKDWTPPGTCVKRYSRGGQDFEIWASSLLDPVMRALVDNIQILILFFIEGGQFINLDDVDWTLDRWRVYLLYQKASRGPTANASPYSFVGYATTYRFFRFLAPNPRPTVTSISSFPPTDTVTPNKLTSRLRISQFLILPPYQSSGHGSALYQAIYSEVMADPTIMEMTVEDPSEEFDKLRDMNDFDILEPQFQAAGIKIDTSSFTSTDRSRIRRMPTATLLPVETLQAIRAKNKMAGRQFARMVEMYLLAQIPWSHRSAGGASLTSLKIRGAKAPDPADRSYYWWRLLLKQRILKKNKDLLLQLPLEDRAPQIEDSARAQEDEYEGLILSYALRRERELKRHGNGEVSSRKRKIVDSEDDEDTADDRGSIESSKKAKT